MTTRNDGWRALYVLIPLLVLAPAEGGAQSPCASIARFGIPAPTTAPDAASATQTVVTWLRQFRNYDDARTATDSLRVDLPAILDVEFSSDSSGWSRFREALDQFDEKPESERQRYVSVMQQVRSATAAQRDQCIALSGLKVWLEYVSPRQVAIAAQFKGVRESDRTTIDRLILDQSKLVCDSTLSAQGRAGILPRRSNSIGAQIRRAICQRRVPDETRIVVVAEQDPLGGAALLVASGESIEVTAKNLPSSARSYTPPHTRGDREFARNGPTMRAEAWLEADSTGRYLYLRIGMRAQETGGDRSTADGTSPMTAEYLVFSAPEGLSITEFPLARDTMEARTDGDEPIGVQAGGGWVRRGVGGMLATKNGIIDSWEAVGRAQGEDAGVGTHVRVTTSPLLVKLRKKTAG